MFKKRLRFLVMIIIAGIMSTQVYFLTGAASTASQLFGRIWGIDRYSTAIKVSQKGWTASQYVILARGDDFFDALCAGPLAGKYNAPILLTECERLTYGVLKEIRRLDASNIIIVGDSGAVSEKVESALAEAGLAVDRINGGDRYVTSVEIAKRMGDNGNIALATGEDFPDALSISSVASRFGMPILLTEGSGISGDVLGYIKENDISKVYIIGGTGVIGKDVEDSVNNPVRLGGSDRYETNEVVMEHFKDILDFERIYIVTGRDFPDALTGGVLASLTSSPLILVEDRISSDVENFILSYLQPSCYIIALGGPLVTPHHIADQIINEVKSSQQSSPTRGANNIDPTDESGYGGNESVVIDKEAFGRSTPFNISNGAPGDTFSAVYHIKNTGTLNARLTAVFNYEPSSPDIGTQLIIENMTFDGKPVVLPEVRVYGELTLADLNGVEIMLTNNLLSRMKREKDFVIYCSFSPESTSQNRYMGTGMSGSFTFEAVHMDR